MTSPSAPSSWTSRPTRSTAPSRPPTPDVYASTEVDGIKVRYARQGTPDGKTVVLLHGFGGDLDNWLFNLGPLAAVADVVALDLPGHGQSAVTLPAASVEALAGFVAAFLDGLGVGRAPLLGHSVGAAVAAQLALEQ